MQITLVPDSSIALAPAGLTAAVDAAAAIYEEDFPGNYNINISYGWGTFDNTSSNELTNPNSGVYSLGGGTATTVSYSQLKGWLTASADTSTQIAADATLPASSASFPGDANTFFASFAEEKALGVFTGDSSAIDGSIGFNIGDASTSQDWEPAALTEIAHALGWDSIAGGGSFPDVSDLFRYSSPGHYGWTSGQSAYFSIDGGNTDLADFATSFDQTLFTDLPADDPLRLPFTSAATTLTAFDIEALSVIGFGVANVVSLLPRRFNAGGNSSDALLQKNDGNVAIWQMNGTNLTGGGPVADPGPTWTAIGTGDFNGDGHSDILLQSNDGSVAVWEMNGTSLTSGAVVADPGPSWHALGTGDFNGDGRSDILLQSNDGSVAIWEMNGTSLTSGAVVADPGPSWHALGTGDFNGDGRSDILLQNNDGSVAIWEMNGTSVVGSAVVADPGPTWSAVGTGDFNDDGHSDILFQNASGQAAIWEMNGTNLAGSGVVASNPGPSWRVI
ncbi:MAG: FG-GAP-like repeat-containing protein [Roseiarcus sp.]